MLIEIYGFLFEIFLGTIGHFLYDLSNNNKIIGFLFSRNESIWEHMKLGITPILLWTIIELFTTNHYNIFFAMFLSIIAFIFSLLILYTIYKLIINKNVLFIDITIFYISLFLSTIVSLKIIYSEEIGLFFNILSFFGILFIIYLYFKFNKNTPNWYIFKYY